MSGLIIGELISNIVYYVYKGFMSCVVIVKGKVVYSFMLYLGINVVDILVDFVNEMK